MKFNYPASGLVVVQVHEAAALLARATLVVFLPLAHVHEALREPGEAYVKSVQFVHFTSLNPVKAVKYRLLRKRLLRDWTVSW